MDEALRRTLSGAYDDILALFAVRDRFSEAQLLAAFERILVERHLAAYFAGNGGADLTPYADRVLGAAMQEQLDYARAFIAQQGGLSDAQATARALMYVGALKASYARGKYEVWQLPAFPGDGQTECLGNCRCAWEVRVLNEEELDADAYWRLGPTEHCPGCQGRATRYRPLRIRGGVYAA